MFGYIWPIGLVVISNVIYQVCAKSVPDNVDPYASLTVTYLIGAVISAILFFVTNKSAGLFNEYGKLNWASVALGISIVGLEVGWIFAYKAGWQVSTGSIVQSSFLALALIIVGRIVFSEPIVWNKLLGVVICLVGLVFINLK